MFKLLFKVFNFLSDIHLAKKIKADPEKQQTSKRFGVATIGGSIGFVVGSLLVGFFAWLFLNTLGVFGYILVGALAIGMFLDVLLTLKNWFLQLYINKKPITWISLAVMIAAFVAGAVIVWYFLTKI